MATVFKRDEIVILLGAGASVDAGIPHSFAMVNELEQLLREDQNWEDFTNLYNYIKSAIIYADGIKGRFISGFNIERLVSTLDDLRKGDEHPLYPFIGSWSPKLAEVAGSSLERLQDFREKIVLKLRDEWVQLKYDDDAKYYTCLCDFQKEFEHPLRIFTLNYDLCVEKSCTDVKLERGFSENKTWDWRVFDPIEEQTPDIYLYKMHGSVDWERDENGKVTFRDAPSRINAENLEIIFGTTYKLQYVDPFLFFAYEFRRWTLSAAKVIIALGYGFGDEHINGILAQALKSNSSTKVLAITGPKDPKYAGDQEYECKEANRIMHSLDVKVDGRIRCKCLTAKEFLSNHLSIERLAEEFPSEETPFEEIGQDVDR